MTNQERVFIILDGSNFYHHLKSKQLNFKNTSKFDYKGFVYWLARNRKIISYIYYVGLIRGRKDNQKSMELVKRQQRLFSFLKNQGWLIETGFMMENDGRYYEKGVDVKIAVDILDKAHKDEYDTVIVISSDTDLLPAIQRIKGMNKKIEYIGFAYNPSFAMQQYADVSKLLAKEELEKFFPKS